MGVGKKKKEKRVINFYRLSFGVTEPYRVLIQPDFLRQCIRTKINVREQLVKILQGRAYPVITRCILEELRAKGKGGDLLGAAVLARKFQMIQCKHTKVKKFDDNGVPINEPTKTTFELDQNDNETKNELIEEEDAEKEEIEEELVQIKKKRKEEEKFQVLSASSCIKEILKGSKPENSFVLAVVGANENTKIEIDRDEVPCYIPFVIFQPPSYIKLLPASVEANSLSKQKTAKKEEISEYEKLIISKNSNDDNNTKITGKKRKRKTHNPNPLSVKKKHKKPKLSNNNDKTSDSNKETGEKKKRKRVRKKKENQEKSEGNSEC